VTAAGLARAAGAPGLTGSQAMANVASDGRGGAGLPPDSYPPSFTVPDTGQSLLAQAKRLAYADLLHYNGDPRFVHIP